jgi:hypothetical protein
VHAYRSGGVAGCSESRLIGSFLRPSLVMLQAVATADLPALLDSTDA